MKIQEYIEQVHQTATEHGWHEQKQSTEHWLMLIITEICEMIEADRENNHARREIFEHRLEVQPNDPDDRFKEWFKPYIKDTFEDELADICIRTIDLMGESGISVKQFDKIHTQFNPDFYKQELPKQCFDIIGVITDCDALPIVCNNILKFAEHVAENHGVDLEWHIEQKMRYNQLREWKHGNKAY